MKAIKSIALALATLASAAASAQTGEGLFSYHTDGSTPGVWGTNKVEHYDVAIHINDAGLAGHHITSIVVPFDDVTGITNATAWVSSALALEETQEQRTNADGTPMVDANGNPVTKTVKTNKTDASWTLTASRGNVTVQLPEAYTIPAEGIYVGYSFDVEKNGAGNFAQYPVVLAPSATAPEGSFYIHTERTYRTWRDKSADLGGVSAMCVGIDGIASVGAGLSSAGAVRAGYKDASLARVNVINHGSTVINNIDIAYEVGGKTGEVHVDLATAIPNVLGATQRVEFTLPALGLLNNHDMKLTLARVNGVANDDAGKTVTVPFVGLIINTTHRALLEEYTGTWCTWCPRGLVGLEKMAALYPNDFVALSYHNGDPMDISSNYPSSVAGFPDAWIDRAKETDAFLGDNSSYAFGVDKAWLDRCETVPAMADITAKAAFSADESELLVNGEVTFAADMDKANYKVEVMLVADGLTATLLHEQADGSYDTDPSWNQVNVYAGQTAWGADPDMREFVDGKYTTAEYTDARGRVKGFVFNDVIIASTRLTGDDIELPASVKGGEPIAFSHAFSLNRDDYRQGVQTWSDELYASIKKEQLRVVVAIIDAETGIVDNANLTQRGVAPTGITSLSAGSQLAGGQTQYFDLSGRRLAQPQKGINVVRTAQGKTYKVVVK